MAEHKSQTNVREKEDTVYMYMCFILHHVDCKHIALSLITRCFIFLKTFWIYSLKVLQTVWVRMNYKHIHNIECNNNNHAGWFRIKTPFFLWKITFHAITWQLHWDHRAWVALLVITQWCTRQKASIIFSKHREKLMS